LDEIKDFDAVILPGGFGAAKNLSSFAYEGEQFKVEPSVQIFLQTVGHTSPWSKKEN